MLLRIRKKKNARVEELLDFSEPAGHELLLVEAQAAVGLDALLLEVRPPPLFTLGVGAARRGQVNVGAEEIKHLGVYVCVHVCEFITPAKVNQPRGKDE